MFPTVAFLENVINSVPEQVTASTVSLEMETRPTYEYESFFCLFSWPSSHMFLLPGSVYEVILS